MYNFEDELEDHPIEQPKREKLLCESTRLPCPYKKDVNGVIEYCDCSPEKRRECAEDI